MRNPHPRFFDLARLKQQLDADSNLSLRTLRKRDDGLKQKITARKPLPQLLTWLDLLESQRLPADNTKSPNHLEGLLLFGLIILGFVLGVLSMTGVLFANQQQPVNILLFLGLFIGLQLLLVTITLIGAYLPITAGFRSNGGIHSPLSFLNPAAWALKRGLHYFSHSMPWQQVPRLTRLVLLRWGQAFGISFNIALLLSFWLALLVSDRSFGWSSTLNFSDSTFLNLLRWLSLPWSWLGDSVSANGELVSATRFQSLQTQFSPAQVEVMRRWWPFLLSALLTYGLLPRLLLFLVFDISLKVQLKKTLLQYPGVKLVLDRLNKPTVSTQPETHDEHAITTDDGAVETTDKIAGNSWVVDWSNALAKVDGPSLEALGILLSNTPTAGLDLNHDTQVIDSINQAKPETVVIAVKSWEPPLAELADFIAAINMNTTCVLLLVALNDKTISSSEWKDWQHFVRHNVSRPVQLLRADDG